MLYVCIAGLYQTLTRNDLLFEREIIETYNFATVHETLVSERRQCSNLRQVIASIASPFPLIAFPFSPSHITSIIVFLVQLVAYLRLTLPCLYIKRNVLCRTKIPLNEFF